MKMEGRRPQRAHTYLSTTRALCPVCREVVDGARLLRDGKVYLRRRCPQHGASEALISGDAEWFLASQAYVKPGWIPLEFSTEANKGCPLDCGLCPEHEQHSCLPIIEVTNHCNLDCPICIVRNAKDHHMSRQTFAGIIDNLIRKEGTLDAITVSGGEPTLHPDLFGLLEEASRPEIARVSLSTNGLRLAADPELCRELARRRVYVNLQFDGFESPALGQLRGDGDHASVKRRALANLEAAGCRAALVATVARGINEEAIGQCFRLLCEKDFILSVVIQPAAYTGTGESFAPHDPMNVLTIPDVVRSFEGQTAGKLVRSDFLPMPCSHPSCFALTYLLKTESGFVPLPRFLELDRFLRVIENRATMATGVELEETMRATIDDLWASTGQIPDNEKILRALRRALELMYPEHRKLGNAERMRVGEGLVKSIYIHAFMDEHTFDVERVRKCCNHYALPDGRLMPACAYNMLYRPRGL